MKATVSLAFELEEPEDAVALQYYAMCDTFASLQARVAAVEAARKTSPRRTRDAKRMSR